MLLFPLTRKREISKYTNILLLSNYRIMERGVYKYPDIDDRNFYGNIKNTDWEDGGLEDKYIYEAIQYIPKEQRKTILDAGCGLGKQIPKLISYFEKIIAIDPDKERLKKAEEIFNRAKNIEFSCASIQEFVRKEILDCILCSQIIQHVHTKDVQVILDKFKSLLKKSGYLIILTTNCLDEKDVFLKVNCETNEHIPLTEEAYNGCVEINDIHLPTRLFTEITLKRLLNDAGFEILFLRKFNGYPKIKGDNFIFARSK